MVGADDAIFPRLVKVALQVSDRLWNALRLLRPGRCRSDGLHLRHPAVGIDRGVANFELGKFHFAQVELGQFRRSQVQGFGSGLPGGLHRRLLHSFGERLRGGAQSFITTHQPFEFAGLNVHHQSMHRNVRANKRALPNNLRASNDVLPLAGKQAEVFV